MTTLLLLAIWIPIPHVSSALEVAVHAPGTPPLGGIVSERPETGKPLHVSLKKRERGRRFGLGCKVCWSLISVLGTTQNWVPAGTNCRESRQLLLPSRNHQHSLQPIRGLTRSTARHILIASMETRWQSTTPTFLPTALSARLPLRITPRRS